MSPLMRVALVLLVLVFLSTSFYMYTFYQQQQQQQPPPEPQSSTSASSASSASLSTMAPTIKGTEQPTQPPKIEGNYMCNVAVGIYTAPQHKDTRVVDASKSWTTRICPYGTPQWRFIGLAADLNVERSIEVPCGSDYFSLCCKSMEGLARLYKAFPNADWYYKVDDDTLLVPRNADAMLSKQDPNDKLLLGWMIEAEIDNKTKEFHGTIYEPRVPHKNGELYDTSIMYCSGSGYVMSGGLVRGMMQNMTRYEEVWKPICELYEPEDVAVGLFAAKFGARVAKVQGVYNKDWNWNDGPNDFEYDVVSVHLSRDTKKMVYFDRLLNGPLPRKTPS